MKAFIKVAKKDWSGWSKSKEESQALETTNEVQANERLTSVSSNFGNISATVKSINPDSVILLTSHLSPQKSDKGIDLRTDYSALETPLKIGESARFITQTMDAGTWFTFTLIDIKE